MSRPLADRLLPWASGLCAALAAGLVLLVAAFLAAESGPALRHIGLVPFLADPGWNPGERRYNILPMLAGTFLATAGAVLLAAPLGLASALFANFYAPPALAAWHRRLLGLLAGIPSVVFGLWGLVNLVPLIGRLRPPGPSLLAAVLVLAIMILPTIALLADAALAAVPRAQLRAAAALGLSRWATVRGVALPAARPGLLAAIALGTGRALGETMAVVMVCGNVPQLPTSVFAPVRPLTAHVALEMAYAVGDHRAALFVGGLVLLAAIVVLAIAADFLGGRRADG